MRMRQEFFGVAEVAALLELRPVTIYRWCRTGRLPGIKLGKEWRIPRAALEDLLHRSPAQRLADHTDEGVTMHAVSPATRELAQRLLWNEAGGRLGPEVLPAAERTFGLLRRRLTDLLGQAGFTALLRRALHLAQAEYPILTALVVGGTAAETLSGLRELEVADATESASIAVALTALLAHLIWLMVTFIGEDLTIRLIDEIWPERGPDVGDPPVQGGRQDA